MKWRYKVNIKQFLNEDESKESIEQAYNGINKELEQIPFAPPFQWDHYSEMAIEQGDVNLFNMGLNFLYDWADQKRIWLGM